jgi:hypothetical protein
LRRASARNAFAGVGSGGSLIEHSPVAGHL